jgi:methyl-accepting chemotaxis protein
MIQRVYFPIREKLLGLRLGVALFLILVLGLIPALFLGVYYVESAQEKSLIVASEREGLELLRHLQSVDNFILNPPEDFEALKAGAKKALSLLEKSSKHEGHLQSIAITDEVHRLRLRLQLIANTGEGSARKEMDALIAQIGDRSGLILDPELESYYLMDIVLNKSRRVVKAAAELRDANFYMSSDQNELLVATRDRLREASNELKFASSSAAKHSADGAIHRGKFIEQANASLMAANRMLNGDVRTESFNTLFEQKKRFWWTAAIELDRALVSRSKRVDGEVRQALMISGGAASMAVLLALLLIVALADGMGQISQRLRDLADGDHDSPVPGLQHDNDIGVIANALQSFIELSGQLDEQRQLARVELEETVAAVRSENELLIEQVLSQEAIARETERGAVVGLANDLETQVSGLLTQSRAAVQQMDQEALSMVESADGIQRQAANAAAAAYEINRLVEELAPVVSGVSQQLHGYTGTLTDAQNQAVDAVLRVETANQRIAEFNAAANRVGAMLDLISNVARTTNMLALNAAIEAVSVGESGRGFMVVAEEVKALASSTREATRDIAGQIESMNAANAAVASAFAEILDVVQLMASQSKTVSVGMVDQTSAISQVAISISKASDELSKMVVSIDSADAAATSAKSRSAEMMTASQHVNRNVVALDDSVRVFLGGIVKAQNKAA